MKPVSNKTIICAIALLLLGGAHAEANTRTVEFKFQLSSDAGSEFSAKLPLLSPGVLVAQATWSFIDSRTSTDTATTPLVLILLRPDGTEAARASGASPLRFEMRVTEQEVNTFNERNRALWTIKVVNGAGEPRREVAGKLRVTVPVAEGTLIDTSFSLLGSGNAQEFSFALSTPGKLVIETNWRTDSSPAETTSSALLSLSLIHPGEDKTYARRQDRNPLRIEQQITQQDLDKGARWQVRVQNESQLKVRATLKVTFTPSL